MHPEDERDCTLSRLETLMVFFSDARLARTATSLYSIGISLNFHSPYSRDHHVT
jgi:hypothetical protein